VTSNYYVHLFIQPPWYLALPFAAAFALLAWAARLLTGRGALATFLVGFVVFGLGGGLFTIPLLTFFFTSSLLSRIGRSVKAAASQRTAKGATRDAAQVLANGGVATALVLLFHLVVHRWPVDQSRYLLMLYLAALATVNADTWATEIGGLSRAAPRLLSDWKPAPAGSSGAITGLGLLAALIGSVVVPFSVYWAWGLNKYPVEFIAVAWAGFLGSCVDSVLGAGLQAQYRDPVTGQLTERTEIDGRKTVRVRGWAWMNNDMVNFLASVGGVVCAWALLRYAAYPYH
jgi:uncharacterized protein (TIGR00297 family)